MLSLLGWQSEAVREQEFSHHFMGCWLFQRLFVSRARVLCRQGRLVTYCCPALFRGWLISFPDCGPIQHPLHNFTEGLMKAGMLFVWCIPHVHLWHQSHGRAELWAQVLTSWLSCCTPHQSRALSLLDQKQNRLQTGCINTGGISSPLLGPERRR